VRCGLYFEKVISLKKKSPYLQVKNKKKKVYAALTGNTWRQGIHGGRHA
jgi:hypothetical protein